MLQPIELLKKELAELKVVANRRGFSKLKIEANTLIPAYENSIRFMEAVNGVDASHHQALHKHIVSLVEQSGTAVCDNCGQTLDKHSVASNMCPDRFAHFEQTES